MRGPNKRFQTPNPNRTLEQPTQQSIRSKHRQSNNTRTKPPSKTNIPARTKHANKAKEESLDQNFRTKHASRRWTQQYSDQNLNKMVRRKNPNIEQHMTVYQRTKQASKELPKRTEQNIRAKPEEVEIFEQDIGNNMSTSQSNQRHDAPSEQSKSPHTPNTRAEQNIGGSPRAEQNFKADQPQLTEQNTRTEPHLDKSTEQNIRTKQCTKPAKTKQNTEQ